MELKMYCSNCEWMLKKVPGQALGIIKRVLSAKTAPKHGGTTAEHQTKTLLRE